MIHVLYTSINEENHKKIIDHYLPDFSAEYQDKIKRYRRWQDAQLSLLGRILLVKGLEQINYGFDESNLNYTSFNKPYLENNAIHFNISHSGELVVCALTKIGAIGIDIEKINGTKISDFKSQMTVNEWKLINESTNANLSFFQYWTQKEAVIKTHGKGLSIPLKSFEVTKNKTIIESELYFLKELKINDDYCCHLALKENIDTIEIITEKINF